MAFLNDPTDQPAKVIAQPPAPPPFTTHIDLVAVVAKMKADLEALRAEYDAHVAANTGDKTASWITQGTVISS